MKALIKAKLVHPLLALSAVFFILAGATFISPPNRTARIRGVQTISKKAIVKPTSTPTATPVPTAKVFYKLNSTPTPTYGLNQNSSATPTHSNASRQASTPVPTATQVKQNQNSQVNLSVNGSSVGQINVTSGQNQCDVLNDALAQGKISSLNMKYDNNLGTYGVYQINGIGKENAIWWVYKVNGNSPNQGCSYIKAAAGDNIEWNYIGS